MAILGSFNDNGISVVIEDDGTVTISSTAFDTVQAVIPSAEWARIGSYIDPNSLETFHSYVEDNKVRSTEFLGLDIPEATVWRNLKEQPAPTFFYDRDDEVSNGGEIAIPTVISGFDTVKVFISETDKYVMNVTQTDHFLNPGVVIRVLYERDDAYYVATVGFGNGDYPELNEHVLNWVWPNNAWGIGQESKFEAIDEYVGRGLYAMYRVIEEGVNSTIDSIKALIGAAKVTPTPIILDLDNDGIELTDISVAGGAVYFDVNNNGYAEATAWFTGGDGMLTIDLNADNLVQAGEIFGNSTGYDNGFLALAQYDVNADGKITAEDAPYDDMRVWIDANMNGYAEEGELTSLADMLITEISLAYTDVNYQVNGNDILQESTFVINGNTRDIGDAYFATNQANSVYDQGYELDPDVLFLPTLRGYGTIADMHIAASIDNTGTGNLKDLLESFSALTLANAFAATTDVPDDVRAILYRWAGVDAVSPTARGGYVDAQQLGFLEKLVGQDFVQRNYSSNPLGPQAGYNLQEAFTMAINHYTAMLMAQTEAGELLTGDFFYNIATDSIEGITGLDLTVLGNLETEATGLANTGLRTTFWQNVVRMVEYTIGTANLDGGDLTALEDAVYDSDNTLTLTGIIDSIEFVFPVWNVNGTSGSDTLSGTSGADKILGYDGHDTISGLAGDDELNGGAGDDVLTGGVGDDLVHGGGDDDVFVYNAGDGFDTYTDDLGADRIVLGAGIVSGDVTLSRALNGKDLIIDIDNGVDPVGRITVEDHFVTNKAIETLEFNDTTTINLTTINWTQNGTAARDRIEGVQVNGGNVDTIYGGADGDTVLGYAGDDVLYGEAGNDLIYGGDDTDTIYGGDGWDTMYGEAGNDVIHAGTGNDKSYGGAGDDDYHYTSGKDYIDDTSGTDEIFLPAGYTSGATVYYKHGNDLEIVFDAANSIYIKGHYAGRAVETLHFNGGPSVNLTTVSTITQGADTNDTINGTSSADTFYGGAGNDTITANNGNDYVYGGTGNDSLSGGGGDDHLFGGAGDDYIYDNSGTNVIYYISGHDEFQGGSYNSTSVKLEYAWELSDLTFSRYYGAYSGSEWDLVIGISAANSITLDGALHASMAAAWTYLEFTDTSTVAFNTIYITTYGTAGNNSITGNTHVQSDEIIYAGAGNDTVNAGAGSDTVYGGDDADNLNGQAGVDYLYGESGNDDLDGGTEEDYLYGGDGDDVLSGGSGTFTDYLYGEDGNDDLYGYDGVDHLYGGAGDDYMTGGNGSDFFYYSEGMDEIYDLSSSSPADRLVMMGGITVNDISFVNAATLDTRIIINSGVDEVYVTRLRSTSSYLIEEISFDDGFVAHLPSYASWTTGTTGADSLTGTGSANTIIGKAGADTLDGAGGNDAIHGGADNDTVKGGAGDDQLHGGTGDDFIWGEDGLDTMWGGAGADVFVFEAVNAYNNIDVIKDFSLADSDVIDINNLLSAYDPMTDILADFVEITDSGANSIVRVDRDGTGGTYGFVQIATLEGITGLTDEAALVTSGHLVVS